METYLWKIKKEKLNKTNLALYSNFIYKNYKIKHNNDFNKIWKWSVENPKNFWKSILRFRVRKVIALPPKKFTAFSYSENVGHGISTLDFLFTKVLQKL